ncbi:MAG: nitroreductase family protein [Candidatus Bathyarchaeia archaeon]
MTDNPVLETIRKRRSIIRYDNTPVPEEKLTAILEAGRWAPSWLNRQPWTFIVIGDQAQKDKLSQAAPTAFAKALREAPLCIAVAVNPEEDPYHFVEDGTTATQNMALAAESLGLHTSWIGVFDLKNPKDSAENKIKQILDLPKNHRVVSLLPVGYTSTELREPKRKSLDQVLRHDRFGT